MTDPLTALITALIILAASAGFVFIAIPRWRRARQQTDRMRMEDALKHILG